MAPYPLRDCRFYLGGHDLSGSLNRGKLDASVNLVDSTPFGALSVRRTPGVSTASLDLDGYYEAGDGTIDDVLDGRTGAGEELLSVFPQEAVPGSIGYSFASLTAKLSRGGSYGEMCAINAQARSSGPIVHATLMEIGSKAATGNGAGRQLGAVAEGRKIYAIAHVLSGTGALGLKLQSAPTQGGTYVDRASFAYMTGRGAQRVSAIGPVADEYWRAAWTVSGGPFGVVIMAGIL